MDVYLRSNANHDYHSIKVNFGVCYHYLMCVDIHPYLSILFGIALTSIANTAIVCYGESMLSIGATSSENRWTLGIHFMRFAINFLNRLDNLDDQ